MPSPWTIVSDSPPTTVPSSTPVTGLSRPTTPTVPAGRCASPRFHATYASPVATTCRDDADVDERDDLSAVEPGRRAFDEQRDGQEQQRARRELPRGEGDGVDACPPAACEHETDRRHDEARGRRGDARRRDLPFPAREDEYGTSEADGLVTRRPADDDGRRRVVALTAAGRDLIDDAFTEHLANEARLLAALPEQDAVQLERILTTWLAALDE